MSYPQQGATKRVVSGSLLNILGEGIRALSHVLLVPLFLRAWGKELYGEWLSICAVVAYLSLSDLGIKNYVTNRLTQAYSKGDLKRYWKIFYSALRLYLALLSFLMVAFGVFVFFAPLSDWLGIKLAGKETMRIAFLVMGGHLLIGLILGLFSGVYQSMGKYSRAALILNVKEIILLVFLAVALFLNPNFIAISLIYFLALLTLLFFVVKDTGVGYARIGAGLAQADWNLSFSFIAPSLFFLMLVLGNTLRGQSILLVINGALGAGAVAVFSVHRTLSNLIQKIVTSINGALCPELTAMEERKNFRKMQLTFHLLIKIALFLSFSAAIFLFFTGEDVIRVWTRGRIEFQPLLWLIFMIYMPISALWWASGIFQVSTNKHKKYALTRVGSSVIGLLLAMILTKTFGLAGALAGFAIAEILICGPIVPNQTLKIINGAKKQFWLNTVGKGLLVLPFQISVAFVLSKTSLNIFFQWGLVGTGIMLTGILAMHLFWLSKEEERQFLQLITGLKNKLRQNALPG